MSAGKCPFTGLACDGGKVYSDGTVGCAFKKEPDAVCEWTGELPEGTSPRDFYNQALMEAAMRREGGGDAV